MRQDLPPDLFRWLDAATRGLRPDLASRVQAELAAHYEDALADYLDEGLPELEARTRALACLGEAEATARGLNDVHRGRRRYALAAGASMAIIAILFGVPVVHETLGLVTGTPASNLVIALDFLAVALLTVYVMLTLGRLLDWRYGVTALQMPLRVLSGALLLDVTAQVVGIYVQGGPQPMAGVPDLLSAPSALHLLLQLAIAVGFLLTAAGLLVCAVGLLRLSLDLYGLTRLLAYLLVVYAAGFSGTIVLANLGLSTLAEITYILVMAAHAITWPLLTLLFFRAVYRPRFHPARLA